MKKIAILSIMILALFVAGCAQKAQPTASSGKEDASKTAAQPKSDFPKKPIEMIVPTPAGGSYDAIARELAKIAPKYLPNKASMVVINKSSGNSTLGLVDVMNAKPDGYTIGFVPSSTITYQPHVAKTPYSHDSFQPIMKAVDINLIMYVKADAPYKNFDEWLDYVKKNPDKFSVAMVPGAKYLLEKLNKEAGTKIKIVPFDGYAPSMTAFLGGHVDAAIVTYTDARSALDEGKIRPIFTSSANHVGDIPSLKSKGFGIEDVKFLPVIAPKGLPKEELTILHDAFKKTMEDPEFIDHLKKLGHIPSYAGPEDVQKELSRVYQLELNNLKEAGLLKQ